jgi:hypothetical protein
LKNPQPDVPVDSIDIVSGMTRSSVFIIAITGEP